MQLITEGSSKLASVPSGGGGGAAGGAGAGAAAGGGAAPEEAKPAEKEEEKEVRFYGSSLVLDLLLSFNTFRNRTRIWALASSTKAINAAWVSFSFSQDTCDLTKTFNYGFRLLHSLSCRHQCN